MKRFILLFVVIMLFNFSCQENNTINVDSIKSITYFKDIRTGLCFGALKSVTYGPRDVTSITCVPCDSLKNVDVKIIVGE